MDAYLVNQLKQSLSQVTLRALIDKVSNFRSLDIKRLTDQELSYEISKVLQYNDHESILPTNSASYFENTSFFRVRSIPEKYRDNPLAIMQQESDVWNAPEHLITSPGRLNKIHESLLYVAPIKADVAFDEMKIKQGETVWLIHYKSTSPVKVNRIGYFEDSKFLTDEENMKLATLINFLRDEFTRDVGTGTEFLYRISELIAKEHYDLPPRIYQDAWCYPSVAKKPSVNVCFRPEIAKDLLSFEGAYLCFRMDNENGLTGIGVKGVISKFLNEEDPVFHGYGTEECERLMLNLKNKF